MSIAFGTMPAPTPVVLFPDPVARAIAWLGKFFPLSTWISQDEPANRANEMIIITDTGGAGVYDVVFDETRLTVDVWAQDSVRASEMARTVYALLRAWPGQERDVYMRRGWSRPRYFPDDETRIPRYVLTVQLAFRGATVEVSPSTT